MLKKIDFFLLTLIKYSVYCNYSNMNYTEPVTQSRTQLYLPASLYKKLKNKVKEENISLAEFIRRLLAKELNYEVSENVQKKDKAWAIFLKAAGIGKGSKDLSYKHDKYFDAGSKIK